MGSLGEAKALGALVDCQQELRPQKVVVLIGGKIELIEAGVRTGQPCGLAIVAMNLELLRAIHACLINFKKY